MPEEPALSRAATYLSGRQYGRPEGVHDPELQEVGPGKPMGELMRRYWQPFALSAEITNDLPLPIRILGEDLVAFRDAKGNAGLMYPRCAHRGASLVYGKIEAEGIRCPYHGWKFNTVGQLLDTPCEVDPKSKRLHNVVRQPWYPVVEKYGIAFTYMGPPEKEPLLPRFSILEDLAADEIVIATGGSQPTDVVPMSLNEGQMDMNWLQNFENFMDPYHLTALHFMMNGNQFSDHIVGNPVPCKMKSFRDGEVSWIGHWKSSVSPFSTQTIFQTIIPNIHIEGPIFTAGAPHIGWVVPVDDTNLRSFYVRVIRKSDPPSLPDINFLKPDKWGPRRQEAYRSWTLQDKQRWQSDYIVQRSLGPIALHSEERLTTADFGVVLQRRILKQQVKVVSEGGNPVGSAPGEAQFIEVIAGTARFDTKTGELLEGVRRKTLQDYV